MNGCRKAIAPIGHLGLISVLALMAAAPAIGQSFCAPTDGVSQPCQATAPTGFSISLGGETIAGQDPAVIAGETRRAGGQLGTDLALKAANVQVRYDAIAEERRLNVLTSDLRTEFRGGDTVSFRTSTNYGRWIKRAEVRITPLIKGAKTLVLPTAPDGTLAWVMPEGEPADFPYMLRVYDSQGRFDETVPALITRRAAPALPKLNGPVTAAGEGEDRTGRRGIPVFGGLVTVSGEKMPRGTTVMVMGRPVPVDRGGRFVTDLVLPPGRQSVDVSLAAPGQPGVTLTRQISIPRRDWLVTGLADLTIGRRDTALSGREGYTRGRLAFSAKGILQDGTRVTGAFDSGEDQLGRLFTDVLSKRPRSVLDRIGDDNPYLTYGDDSAAVDDAPTSGKLYLKVEKNGNHLGWGDFKAGIDHSAFLSASRNLYGVQGTYGSQATTDAGERRLHLTGYAAQPESLPQRDELRGTGGSVYLLKRRDLVPGSESLRVEIVDPVTGRVVSSRPLTAQDYRIDYFQGRVILTRPLSAEAESGGVVTDGASGRHAINLVAQYEYVPVVTNLDVAAFGGRVEGWLPGDALRLGVTAMEETTDSADLTAHSADLRYQLAPESFVDLEVAESTGSGFGRSVSTDGGFTWNEIAPAGGSERARAFRLGAEIDLGDVAEGANGRLKAWYQDKDAGFQTLSENLAVDQIDWGLGIETRIADRLGLSLGYEDFESGDGNRRQTGDVTLSYDTSPRTTVELGAKLRDEVQAGDAGDTGRRADLGMKIIRELRFDQKVYVTAQTTVARSGDIRRNDRLGFGGTVNLGRSLTAEAEASDGTGGPGARARLTHRTGDAGLLYLGYELDPGREIAGTSLNGDHKGRWLLGAERQVNDRTSYFAEDSYDLFGERKALTQAYGVTYTPSEV